MYSIVAFLRVWSEDLQTFFLFHVEHVLNSKKKKRQVVGTSQQDSALKLTLICACDGNQIYITQHTEPFFLLLKQKPLHTPLCFPHWIIELRQTVCKLNNCNTRP